MYYLVQSATYDFEHDYVHSYGYIDEDLEYEMPEPIEAGHYKRKRSPMLAPIGMGVWVLTFFCFAAFGLKVPQKDNPFFWRTKFASGSSVQQMQEVAQDDYGFGAFNHPDHRYDYTNEGFKMKNDGLRIYLDSYDDFYR